MISFNNDWFQGVEHFKVTPGSKTNAVRTLSGKVWGTSIPGRDVLTLTFRPLRPRDASAIFNWLYANSVKGSEEDADAFTLYVERAETSYSAISQGYENGFKGDVRLKTNLLTVKMGYRLTNTINIDFEVISYEEF